MNVKNVFLILFLLAFCSYIKAQKLEVSGIVKSTTDNEVLTGVTVKEQGSNNATITDLDGKYALNVSPNSILEFSFLGFKPQVVATEGKSIINISLEEESILLSEIVTVGYQTQRKIDLTGAVGVMDMKNSISQSNANPLNSMQGKIAGVQINTDAAPGGGDTSIRIRGMSTTNNNSPLYIIDGIPTTENLNSISSNDIESIQVLKDASSASIYGSRASNGVVVITTKKGKGNKLSVDVNISGSLQTVMKTYDMLNSQEWGEAYWQANKNAGLKPSHPFYGNGDTPN